MAYIRCDYSSDFLKMNTSMIVLLPEKRPPAQAPVIYLLHGLTDNCTGWTRYTSVERYARELEAAVVMPEVQRSFYTDMALGVDYFSYIRQELPEVCGRLFGLASDREKNYIMGWSMGGYGAIKCALTAPSQYAGCAAFSAVTDVAGRWERANAGEGREFCAIFGTEKLVPENCDLFALARKADPAILPAFYLTCGEQDALYEENLAFAKLLRQRNIGMEFLHWSGDHSWDFWDRSLRQAMEALLSVKKE